MTFSFHDIDIILKRKELYYKGLSKGSNHDKKVSIYALQVISLLRKDFEKSYKEKWFFTSHLCKISLI